MVVKTVEPNSGRSYAVILAQKLPPRIAQHVAIVERDVGRTTITFRMHGRALNERWYKELTLDDPWLSDQMLARIALEAP